LPDGTIKILLIVLSKYYFSTLFGSFLLWHWSIFGVEVGVW
jgi:hypothetical protein